MATLESARPLWELLGAGRRRDIGSMSQVSAGDEWERFSRTHGLGLEAWVLRVHAQEDIVERERGRRCCNKVVDVSLLVLEYFKLSRGVETGFGLVNDRSTETKELQIVL